jgi:hypothetical protein
MTIPTEIVAAVITVFGGGVCTAIGFVFVGLSRLSERLARLEEHFGIETETHKHR